MGIVGKVVNAKQVETAAAVVKKATAASAPAAPAAAAVPPEIALYMRGAAWLLPQVADVAALEVVVARGEAGARAAAMTALAAVKGGTDIVAALVAAHPGHETVAARAAGELLGCLVASEGVKVCGVLKAAAGNKKDMVERESAYLASAAMCAFGGHAVEPWAVAEVVPLLLGGFDDAKEEVKLAARAGAKAVGHALSGRAVRLCMASLYPALESTAKPKVKIAALNLISALCADKPEGLEYELPDLIPLLIEALSDTKAAVQDAATVTLAEACGLVRTPETVKLMPLFLAAITHPDSMTTKALEALMDITFCNALGSDSLAILVPVMLRGLRTGEADLTKCACKAACNMLELVASPEVLMCFNDRMIPEFVKTENHAYPEIRELGVKSMHDLRTGLIGAETLAEQRTRAKAGKEEILSAFASYSNAASVPPVAVAFLASLASGEVSGTLSISQNVFSAHELEAATRKALHGALDEAALTSLSAHLHTAYAGTYHRKEMGEEGGDEDDNIVNLPNIICGFAGRVLLRRATFKLERGQIYGLVGQNGVGKTTLLTRIVQRDIYGFPPELGCHYVGCHELEAYQELPDTVMEFMQGACDATGCDESVIAVALSAAGFDDRPDLLNMHVSQLSGGWRMKLGIAKSEMYSRDLLLLDEPTNHLDHSSVLWLQEYLTKLAASGITICIVSHDYNFLAEVLTRVINFHQLKLAYFKCGFNAFQEQNPHIVAGLPHVNKSKFSDSAAAPEVDPAAIAAAAAATAVTPMEGAKSKEASAAGPAAAEPAEPVVQQSLAGDGFLPIVFPDPGKLDGIRSRTKTVMKMTGVTFKYPSATTPQLTNACCIVTLASRVAIVGANGAGKTTLLKLIVGETDIGGGTFEKHENLRLSYIAQHSMHHVEDYLDKTPVQYIMYRFQEGMDKEMAKFSTIQLSEEEKEAKLAPNAVNDVIGRAARGGKLWYELVLNGRKKDDNKWEPLQFIEKGPAYVLKLCRHYDEKLKAQQSGMEVRPISTIEIKKHLYDFGIANGLEDGKIKRMSGGQKCRLVLAAALWSMPHIIALDEPTNYLDNDTLAALTKALIEYKGGVVTISHNAPFVEAVCNERWTVANGEVLCETFKVKRSKDYFDKKKGGSNVGSSADLASMVSGDSTTNLSSLGGSMMGSSADLAGLEISDKAGKKATKVPKKK